MNTNSVSNKCTLCLGPYVTPHNQEDCLLTKSSFCSYCGTSGHFTVACKYHVPSKTKETIPSAQPLKPRATIRVTRDMKSIRPFLRFNERPVTQDIAKNVQEVEKVCKKQGTSVVWVHIPKETKAEMMVFANGL
jgi:hypothetical protein